MFSAGRLFNYHPLDMLEFGVDDFKAIKDFTVPKVSVGTKPCLVFCSPEFEQDDLYKRIKNCFIDFFRGTEASAVRLQGFEHALFFMVKDGKIYFRSYRLVPLTCHVSNLVDPVRDHSGSCTGCPLGHSYLQRPVPIGPMVQWHWIN